MRTEMLIFANPLIEEDEIEEVVKTLRSGWIGTGPKVQAFEEAFRRYTGAEQAVALNSCTAGLHLALTVSGLQPGDEVITTPLSFCATANAVIHAGGTPVFVDIEMDTMNIDPKKIEAAITPRTRAILPVHLAGRPCAMDKIMDIAKRHKLFVIEDAAHCVEGWYHGKKVGAIGDISCFSFYVTKNVVTGEGGMITTNRKEWADKIKMYALHGLSADAWKRYSDEGFKHYSVVFPGYKYNMTDLQASLGIHQLKKVTARHQRRTNIWKRYDAAFAKLPLTLPSPPEENTVHARHLYTVLVDKKKTGLTREDFQQALYKRKIGTGVHFVSLHLHEYYRNRYGFKSGDFPNAAAVSEQTISLPLSAKLTDQDVADVIEAVCSTLS